MSFATFIGCISSSIIFFMFSNFYLAMKMYSMNKMVRDSGQVVSSYPVIIVQNLNTEGPYRPDIVSPDAVRPPPSYNETMQVVMPASAPPSYSQNSSL